MVLRGKQMASSGVLAHVLDDPVEVAYEPLQTGRYVVRLAESDDELAQLHRLNCRTFVHEIPQHADPGNGQLVDKFNDKNIYFAAFERDRAVGMLAVHDQAPFSIAEKMSDPALLAQLGSRPMEVRLLAIEPAHRGNELFAGLLFAVYQYALEVGYSHLLISGVEDRLRMYQRLGFRVLGPAVTSGGVRFVPMSAALDQLPPRVLECAAKLRSRYEARGAAPPASPIALTPGPAQLSAAVARAVGADQLSHRSRRFADAFADVRRILASLVGMDAALFCGSGTLANDIVAATLAGDRSFRNGLILVNGEFGRRLVRQAHRAGLRAGVLRWQWGQPWQLDRVERWLERHEEVDWVWAVHLESSAGMLNDVAALAEVVKRQGRKLCLDCISSVGSVPVDLADVHLATGVANKSLGGVAGVSIVFARPGSLDQVSRRGTPPYLDLVEALATPGPRFTFPSAPLLALHEALQVYTDPARREARFAHYVQLGRYFRSRLDELGLTPLVGEPHACPVITTFKFRSRAGHDRFIDRCRDFGYAVGGQSGYLSRRNWCQLATMGELSIDDCRPLFDRLADWFEQDRAFAAEACCHAASQ